MLPIKEYSITLNLIPGACFALSEDFQVLDSNDEFREFMGYLNESKVETALKEIIQDSSFNDWKSVFTSNKKQEFISTFIAKGELKSATCTLHPLKGTKTVICFIAPINNASKQLLLDASNYFQDILTYSKTWFWHIRADHTIAELSQNFQQVTGMNPEEVLNDSIFKYLVVATESESSSSTRDYFNARESFQGLSSSLVRNGKTIIKVSSNAQPIYNSDGSFSGFIGCTQDISEEHKVKTDLQVALKKLEVSNENLEQFVFMASHDLQEPARLIHSYVKLIVQDETNQLSEKSLEFLNFLKESSESMRSLIHNILDYSNLQSDEQQKEWFSTNEILSLSKLSCTKIIHESEAEIKAEGLPEQLFCYPNQLTRVFQNLFSNSIKFTRPFETPLIELTAFEHPNHLELQISDNGIGIAKEDRSKVFKMFTSLHSKSQYKGYGIGMNIVKKIIENHGGTVQLGDSHLGGTTTTITLPLPA